MLVKLVCKDPAPAWPYRVMEALAHTRPFRARRSMRNHAG